MSRIQHYSDSMREKPAANLYALIISLLSKPQQVAYCHDKIFARIAWKWRTSKFRTIFTTTACKGRSFGGLLAKMQTHRMHAFFLSVNAYENLKQSGLF